MPLCVNRRIRFRMNLCQIVRKTLLFSVGIILTRLLVLTAWQGSFTDDFVSNQPENTERNVDAGKGKSYLQINVYVTLPVTPEVKQEQPNILEAHAREEKIEVIGKTTPLQKNCKFLGNTQQISGRNYTVNFVRDDKEKVLFCEIFKCASTFWKAILKEKMNTTIATTSTENIKPKSDWFRFMFVREPYRRFMSFYVDKLYTPNSGFWRLFSELVPRCKNSKTKRKGCCEDVTFTELLQFVIQEVEKKKPLDPHLTPMHEHCHPCENQFDFVGRMENFTHDAHHVFSELNSRGNYKIAFEDFQKESRTAAVKDYIDRLYRNKLWINRCLPMYDAMLRTWKALQIRGIIDGRISFPFSRQKSTHVFKSEFTAAALDALEKSTDKTNLQQAKTEAVQEIFSTVPRDLLRRIQEFVRPDCLLFGYDLEPDDIFGHNRRLNSRTKYFVSLDEREYRHYLHVGGDKSKFP